MAQKEINTGARGVTEKQLDLLDAIIDFTEENGYPPTRVELAKAVGVKNANAVNDMLKCLQAHGMITVVPGISRGIIINDLKDESVLDA